MRSQSDERLVDLVRAGNDRAFEAIVHRYRKALLRYCGRFLAGPRAEDAVQQAFLNAYRAISADDRSIELRPWLYRIAHNAALNTLRAGANLDTDQISEEIDGVERPDQAAERRERLASVVAAVKALPPRQRDAIVLKELEGRSYNEIAVELQVSDGAVRQLLNRARTTLRAGATAIVPEWALVRLAMGGSDPVASRVADIVAAGSGTAVLAKAGTAFVVAGAVVAGAPNSPLGLSGGGQRSGSGAAEARVAGSASGGSSASAPTGGQGGVIRTVAGTGGGADPRRGGRGHGPLSDSTNGTSAQNQGDSGSSGDRHQPSGDDGRSGGRGSDDTPGSDASSPDGGKGGRGSDDSPAAANAPAAANPQEPADQPEPADPPEAHNAGDDEPVAAAAPKPAPKPGSVAQPAPVAQPADE